MNQHQLDRAVAAATGETVGFIRSMGFGALMLPEPRPRKRYRHRFAKSQHWRRKHRALNTGNGAPSV
jgi:hypothetical protein